MLYLATDVCNIVTPVQIKNEGAVNTQCDSTPNIKTQKVD